MTQSERPRRSALYLPASNAKAVAKARTLPADVIILDLEDAVAPDTKADARAAAVAAVQEGGFGNREVAIRVNAIDTPWGKDDLAAVAGSGADAILVPKVSSPADIDTYNAALASAPLATQLWAMMETCAGVWQLDAIAARAWRRPAGRRLQRVSRSRPVSRRGRAGPALRLRRQDPDPPRPDRAVQRGFLAERGGSALVTGDH
jgi:hypothetical protein